MPMPAPRGLSPRPRAALRRSGAASSWRTGAAGAGGLGDAVTPVGAASSPSGTKEVLHWGHLIRLPGSRLPGLLSGALHSGQGMVANMALDLGRADRWRRYSNNLT